MKVLLNRLINDFSNKNLNLVVRRKITSFREGLENYDYYFANNNNICDKFDKIEIQGKATLNQMEDILVITAHSLQNLTDRSGKKLQFEIAKEIIKDKLADSAIFVFYDDNGSFRFSFIRVNYIGSKKDFTDFKRYTYYVNKDLTNKTFINQMYDTAFTSLDAIQEAFSVEPLTKDFYTKLQNWYFWAIQHVQFPSEPNAQTIFQQTGRNDSGLLEATIKEHRAQNVIRLLTRILFVWFIKQKGLIPKELFDLETLQAEYLPKLQAEHNEIFAQSNLSSLYYKAVLQNLFFASLNCPVSTSGLDNRKRQFRNPNQNRGIDYLMRYEDCFEDPGKFLELINSCVPFLNGGLFECLDDKDSKKYIDGFSDNLPKEHQLIVPDFLFFGLSENIDLRGEYGSKNQSYANLEVEGLIKLLKSYNFTIDENEPNDIEVALDPELLGKVFENLLASFNPETKTTARKQTGSFYTPREIVNYMVDESLILHIKNYSKWDLSDEKLDNNLRLLLSTSSSNPFVANDDVSNKIISSLDNCKIIDPACGSGAFPMGILQKMVHVLRKIDPTNEKWQDLQLEKAKSESNIAFEIKDKQEREDYLKDISDAFDITVNSPDYARKLFLIENCIYGVDIQPVATQISKLRFFISLVVEQKVSLEKENFGIRPLPNLETKFVTANTLIGINNLNENTTIFKTEKIKELKNKLKITRHKLFSAKTKETKSKYRDIDQQLRATISEELIKTGWDANDALALSMWNPYKQNLSSPFFNSEWMFGLSDGFDIVIGNPPYFNVKADNQYFDYGYFDSLRLGVANIASLFIRHSFIIGGSITAFIIPKSFLHVNSWLPIRTYVLQNSKISNVNNVGAAFENVGLEQCIIIFKKDMENSNNLVKVYNNFEEINKIQQSYFLKRKQILTSISKSVLKVISLIEIESSPLGQLCNCPRGFYESSENKYFEWSNNKVQLLGGTNVAQFKIKDGGKRKPNSFILINNDKYVKLRSNFDETRIIYQNIVSSNPKIVATIENKFRPTDDTLNNLLLDSNENMYYILAIINSVVATFYLKKGIINDSTLTIHLDKPYIGRLPIKKCSTLYLDQITRLVKLLLYSENHYDSLNSIYNSSIFNLYFPDHMKDRNIDVIDLIDQDLKTVLDDRDFDELTDNDKDQVINQLNECWSNPGNEIVRRISSFKEKSPDILKIILES